ncbi:MAG: hypothetical protein KatS3mg105_3187 [Gemmatales bacterium]|nr:MAG: hypothetical protein KatS3mg105_3187 [Gemmatales bacterium]
MKHLLSLFVSSLSLVICVAVVAASVQEATPPHVGAETQVTPQCKAARSQVWAAAAWSEQARCWLVVWREGYLNEDACDIWCARVGVDGKPLDPAGVRLTKGDGLKDMPHVASDGKGFLVVWEDLSNGRDWDVRGVLVSADGKVEGQDSILVAGGRHNQCRPDVTFAAGNYVVVWQGLTGDGSPNTPGTAYAVFAARVSPAGKRLDDKPIEVVAVQKASHAFSPVVTSHGNNVLAACYVSSFAAGNDYLARRAIDAAAGTRAGSVARAINDRPPG